MKIFRIFTIAAAALMMAACSTDDIAQLINGDKKNFTATIAAPNSGATTRTEYTEVTTGEAAGTINVAWKVGDEIALIHNGVKDVATVKTVNANGSATIEGIITGSPKDEDPIQLFYPAALVKSVTNDGPVFDDDLWGRISTQDGTLKYIQDNLDFRSAKGQLSVNETSATLKEAATMNSMHAIWKLTLQDDAETPAALSAKKVSVQLTADVPILRASTAELTTPISSFYLAMEPFTEAPITIEATVGDDTYKYEKKSVSIASGKYYQSTVTMAKAAAIDLSTLTADYEAQNGDVLTGKLNGETQPYKITIAAGATVTLDGVTINGEDDFDYSWAGITCEGDATIILKGTNTVTGFYEDYPGIHVLENKTLTIKGTGSLDASSNDYGAGIGGCWNPNKDSNKNCGNITIKGGTVKATGGKRGAGIGGGCNGSCGSITISGGSVTATGGANAAGIGSGYQGNCVAIEISGGTVEATGGDDAAGIGSGFDGARCGDIKITSGVTSVTPTKGADAPNNIGAGSGGTCGTLTFEGGGS